MIRRTRLNRRKPWKWKNKVLMAVVLGMGLILILPLFILVDALYFLFEPMLILIWQMGR